MSAHPDFIQLCPHFELLLTEEAQVVQTAWSPVTDPANNKLFELVIAMGVMQFGQNVEVDHPVRSSGGKNPDVLALVRGKRWAFACKAMHSANPLTYAGAVGKAVEQIDASDAAKGVVVVNLKNILDQDAFWPAYPSEDGIVRYGEWPSAEAADQALELHVTGLLTGWEEAIGGAAGLHELFDGSKAAPIILNYANVVCLVQRNGRPVLTTFRRILPLALGVRDDADALAVTGMLDNAVQRP